MAVAAAHTDVQRYYTNLASGNVCSGQLVSGEVRVHLVTETQADGTFRQHLTDNGSRTDDQGNEYVRFPQRLIVETPEPDY